MKAIETVYRGYRFRSRLEARYAVMLDALGLDWEYEKEGYELSGFRYLPDFWIPAWDCFLEIKGTEMDKDDVIKVNLLAEHSGKYVVVGVGIHDCDCVDYLEKGFLIYAPESERIEDNHMGPFFRREMFFLAWPGTHNALLICDGCKTLQFAGPAYTGGGKDHCCEKDRLLFPEHAINAAKQARFEHGENGAR